MRVMADLPCGSWRARTSGPARPPERSQAIDDGECRSSCFARNGYGRAFSGSPLRRCLHFRMKERGQPVLFAQPCSINGAHMARFERGHGVITVRATAFVLENIIAAD